jgi:hypothetical protein
LTHRLEIAVVFGASRRTLRSELRWVARPLAVGCRRHKMPRHQLSEFVGRPLPVCSRMMIHLVAARHSHSGCATLSDSREQEARSSVAAGRFVLSGWRSSLAIPQFFDSLGASKLDRQPPGHSVETVVGWNKLRAVPAFQNCRAAGTARSLFQPTVRNREVTSDTFLTLFSYGTRHPSPRPAELTDTGGNARSFEVTADRPASNSKPAQTRTVRRASPVRSSVP